MSSRTTVVGIAAASLVLLAACSGGSSDAGSGDAGPDDGGDAGTEAVELRFAWWGSEQLDAIKDEQITLFEEAHPGITVVQEPSEYAAYYDKLATQVAGGNGPDVLQITYNVIAEYAERGALLDLATVEEQLDLSDYAEGSLDGGTYGGKVYGVPTGLGSRGILANTRVFEEAGVPLPDDTTWTWEDYVEIATQISDAAPDGTYGVTLNNTEQLLNTIARQNGDNVYTEDGGVGDVADDASFMFDLNARLIESGAAPDASLSAEQDALALEARLMGTGNVAMSFEPINFLPIYAESTGDELVILDVPNDGGEPGLWAQPTVLYSASGTSEHPEEAAMLIDWLLNSEEAAPLNKLTLGIPANPDVLAAIQPEFTPVEQEQSDFLDTILAQEGAPNVQTPVGGSATQEIIGRLGTEVSFGRLSADDAGEQFVSELETELG
ncbi:ABC transporter substrate-binding protein [Cellulomonas endophytica]|uniref:ABC transporter substrate-binding protein n=1 Tax=Cellulomonas endophytica TaxID=2494735 RepID=UPI0013E9400B|nr:sugar ABC transporter substrate-binding protein [Cellulomonas endophytica]